MGHCFIIFNLSCEHQQEKEVDSIVDSDRETNQPKYWHDTECFREVNNIDHCNDLSNTQEAQPTWNEISLLDF